MTCLIPIKSNTDRHEETMPEMTITAYLAGPDVFLPNAREHARRKVELCARYGIAGRAPLDEDTGNLKALSGEMTWDKIFGQNLAMMEGSDAIIANLTPFRGASADAGTLVELGWFLGRGRPAFGYSQVALPVRGAQPPADHGGR